MSSNLLSGAKILLDCLSRENVEVIFGYPGGVTIPLYDALYDTPSGTCWFGMSKMRHSQPRVLRGLPGE